MNAGIKPLMRIQSIEMDKNGNILRINEPAGNTTLINGTYNVALMMMGMATGAATGGFLWVCAGSGDASTPPVSQQDDRLGGTSASHASAHEYIANGTRKQLMSLSATANPVSASDWVNSPTTIGGITYNWVLSGYVTYQANDPNGTAGGVPFRRYGLNNNSACPSSATGVSGTMLNEVVDTVTNMKTTSNILQVNVYLYMV